ncbi:uncharacterized protein LOC123890995 [Trifolium pratense]|uniref:uncharacterized protein LOC123890995 n=1 Tax=Trifolium pratense TaxID=57577 RepID=UPI001E692826|nr:uncharacterized protein LOC123890995 [Trifolium pratense]
MESKVEKAMISFNPESKTTLDHNPQPKKTSKRSKNIFKVVLLMMRGHSRKSTKAVFPVEDESKSTWRKIVGSMRPMHLQSNQSPPRIINGENNLKNVAIEENNNVDIQGKDGFDYEPESSLSPSPDSSRYVSATNSLYASAVGLNEMVEEEKEEEIGDDGDDMIDAKAEEFIAQFYQEMRLQLMDDIVDHRYKEISMRSLGL